TPQPTATPAPGTTPTTTPKPTPSPTTGTGLDGKGPVPVPSAPPNGTGRASGSTQPGSSQESGRPGSGVIVDSTGRSGNLLLVLFPALLILLAGLAAAGVIYVRRRAAGDSLL
ncbi:MAG TPA: hypothetical protein VF807_03585, partial [Ktedonobacterales bacterium]